MEVTGIFRNFFVVVIAGPYCTGVVRCVAYEPQVIVVLCSTCFSGYRHIVQLAGGTGTFFYNVFHGACKKISGTIFDHRSGNGGVLDQNISVMIKDLCIIDRFDIVPAISNGAYAAQSSTFLTPLVIPPRAVARLASLQIFPLASLSASVP